MAFLYASALAFAPALAAPAAAGTLAPGFTDPQAIVVQGSRDPRHRANDYLDKVMPPSFDEAIGRFDEPLCARVIGLPETMKAEVMARIAQVASVASIRVAVPGCSPNLLIVVVDNKKALIQGMEKHKEAYLYGIDDRVQELENAPGPVAAWQISDVIGADGMPLRVDGDGFPRLFTTVPPSRIVETTRKRVLGGIVVLEQKGLVGVTTRQLADFALLRLLTPIGSHERAAPASSILSLFNDGAQPADAPQSLTYWDLAFLKALADTRSDIAGDIQRHEIRDRIIAERAKLPPEE